MKKLTIQDLRDKGIVGEYGKKIKLNTMTFYSIKRKVHNRILKILGREEDEVLMSEIKKCIDIEMLNELVMGMKVENDIEIFEIMNKYIK